MNTGEWQAVVLCGGVGNRMTELTDHIPKCMLPVAGVPIFWYALNFLQKNSIKDVLLIVNEKQLGEVKLLLTRGGLPPLSGLNVDVVPCCNDDYGTADVLRHFSNKIKKDFIVVSGDFVSDMSLEPVLSLHRAESSAFTCVLAENVITGTVPGPKIKRSKGGTRMRPSAELRYFQIFVARVLNLSFTHTCVVVPTELSELQENLIRYKYVNFTAKYNDCHVYLMQKWILEVLAKERSISSIKADLVPYLLERQYKQIEPEYAAYLECDKLVELANQFSCGLSNAEIASKLRCFAYVLTPENGTIIAHANNLGAYFEVNKAIIRFLTTRFSDKFPESVKNDDSSGAASVSESYISISAHIAASQTGDGTPPRSEKSAVKRSVIGANTSIGLRARITNSLVMDSCIIGPGAHITNSILCGEVEIAEGAEVTSCIVVNRQKVAPNCKVQNELIAPADEMDMDE